MEATDQAHLFRMLRLALMGIVSELVVFLAGYFSPALTTLLLPVYIFIGAVFAVALWRAARRRPGHERRHKGAGDRRHGDRRD